MYPTNEINHIIQIENQWTSNHLNTVTVHGHADNQDLYFDFPGQKIRRKKRKKRVPNIKSPYEVRDNYFDF